MKIDSDSRLALPERGPGCPGSNGGDLSNTELGTLKSYIEALGGRFDVSATFGDQSTRLS